MHGVQMIDDELIIPDLKQAIFIKETWIEVNKETIDSCCRKVCKCMH